MLNTHAEVIDKNKYYVSYMGKYNQQKIYFIVLLCYFSNFVDETVSLNRLVGQLRGLFVWVH